MQFVKMRYLIVVLLAGSWTGSGSAQGVHIDSLIFRFQVFLQQDSTNANVHFNLGSAYVNKGNFQHAVTAFQNAIKYNPDFAEAYNALGYLYGQSRNYGTAIELYQEALKRKPDFPDALNNLGMAYDATGEQRKAINRYYKAIQIDSEYYPAWGNLGFAYYNIGNMDSSLIASLEAVDLKPDFTAVYNNMGLVYFDRNEFKRAIKEYKKTIRIDPYFVKAHYNVMIAYAAQKQYDDMLNELVILVQRDPRVEIFYYDLVLYLVNTTSQETAASIIAGLRERNPELSICYLLEGIVALQYLEDLTSARDALEKAYSLKPVVPEVLFLLGQIEFQAGSLTDSKENFIRYRDMNSTRLELYQSLGFIAIAEDSLDLAVEYFELELRVNPQNERIRQAIENIKDNKEKIELAVQAGKKRARHILVKTEEEAQEILRDLKKGADFAELAVRHSLDPSSANGGDIGFFGAGDLIPEFENAVNDLQVGQISGIIMLKNGFHIIQRLN